jgi:ligand-binding sensor domain-containing protein
VNVRAVLFIIFIGLLTNSTSFFAQNTIRLKTLSTNDGLNFRHVNSIAQDQQGFMWFGTTQGITKYDGNSFKIFNNSKNNPNFIPYEDILDFEYQNSNNMLWYIANHKLFALNLDDEKLGPIEGLEKALTGEVLDIALDKTNNLWIVLDHPIANKKTQHLIKYDGKSFKKIKSFDRKSAGFTSINITNSNQVCWTTVNHGLTLFNQEGHILEQKILDTYDWYGKTIHYGESFFDSKNRYYFFSESKGGIDVYNDFEFDYNLIKHPSVFYNAVEDKNGGVWFTGKKTVFYRNPSGEVIDYTKEIGTVLNSSDITSAYVDFSNLLWLSTDNGLIKVKLIPQNFEKILHLNDLEWGISFRSIFSLNNGVIVAMCETENQLYKINTQGKAQKVTLPKGQQRLKDARFFVSDTANNRAFTVTNALIEIDFNTETSVLYNEFAPFLNETKPNPVISLSDGSLLMGYTLSRLIRVDPETKIFSPIFKEKTEKDFMLRTLFQSKKDPNIVWVGTKSNGLIKLNLNGKIEAQYNITSKPSLNKNTVLSLLEHNEMLLIGTFGGGINLLNLKQNTIKFISTQNGLCDNNVVSILSASQDVIIAATYHGLSRINLKTKDIQNYFEKDGISDNEFNYTSAYKTDNGEFYFGSLNGITKFSYENLSGKKILPALNFTQLEVFNPRKDTLIQTTKLEKNPFILTPYDINLKVDWSIPDYFNKKNYTYYTKMEGFDKQWFYQGHSNSIRYNILPSGEYKLKIKGLDINGNESKAALVIPIIVNPIFYKTWWFILLMILCVAVIIYGVFQYRLNQALAIERLRTKISSDLHDDVGSMLTGLAMQTEMLEMQATNEKDKTKLHKLTNISRNTVSHMRDLVWSIDSRKDTLGNLVERMHELAEDLLLPAGISYHIDIEELKLQKKINFNCRRNLYLIYKEAVNNILRHSNANKVIVEFHNLEGVCQFNIKDNGCLKVKKYSTGIGLANMKMRAKSINADLNFDIEDGFGIYISIPNLS